MLGLKKITVELDHLKRKETNNSTNLFHITTRYNHQELESLYIS